MKISENGKNLLIENEGFRNKVYPDSKGLPTIGIGHLIKPNEQYLKTKVLTDAEVYELFAHDIAHAENWINTNCKWQPNQSQFDVMCSFLHQYNIDSPKYPNTRKAFVVGDTSEICRILNNDFNHADPSKRDNQLVKRRQRELALFKA